jgi:glutaredoxin
MKNAKIPATGLRKAFGRHKVQSPANRSTQDEIIIGPTQDQGRAPKNTLSYLRGTVVSKPTAVLYTRSGCHLCDEAEASLRKYGFEIERVDIVASPELKERYGRCVPVVVIDGHERFRGRVDPRLLRRLVRGESWWKWWPKSG